MKKIKMWLKCTARSSFAWTVIKIQMEVEVWPYMLCRQKWFFWNRGLRVGIQSGEQNFLSLNFKTNFFMFSLSNSSSVCMCILAEKPASILQTLCYNIFLHLFILLDKLETGESLSTMSNSPQNKICYFSFWSIPSSGEWNYCICKIAVSVMAAVLLPESFYYRRRVGKVAPPLSWFAFRLWHNFQPTLCG